MSHRDAEDFVLGSGNIGRRSDGSSTTAAASTTTTTPTTTAAPGTASAMTTAATATKHNKSASDALRLHHDDRLLLRPSLGSSTTAPSGIGRQEGSRGRRGTTDDPSGAVAAATATIMTAIAATTTTTAAKRTSVRQEAVVTPHERLGGKRNDDDDHPSSNKKHKTSHDEEDDVDHDPKRQALWGRLEGGTVGTDNLDKSKMDGVEAASGTHKDINAGNVLHVMVNYHDEIKQLAKTYCRQYESAAAERDYFRGLSNDSRSEIDRLKSNDEQNRKTIASLIRAKEVALAQAREATSVTSQEGTLRAELSDLTQKYDTATTELAESKRTSELLRGELDHVRALLSKCKSDKAKLERSKRSAENAAAAAAAAAQAGGGGGSGGGVSHRESDKSELDFYKAKTSDLNMKLNRLNAVVEEKDRQLVDAQRQLDRNVLMNPHHHPDKIMSSASSSVAGAGTFSAAASSVVNRGGSKTY